MTWCATTARARSPLTSARSTSPSRPGQNGEKRHAAQPEEPAVGLGERHLGDQELGQAGRAGTEQQLVRSSPQPGECLRASPRYLPVSIAKRALMPSATTWKWGGACSRGWIWMRRPSRWATRTRPNVTRSRPSRRADRGLGGARARDARRPQTGPGAARLGGSGGPLRPGLPASGAAAGPGEWPHCGVSFFPCRSSRSHLNGPVPHADREDAP